VPAGKPRKIACRVDQVVAEPGCRLTGRIAPQPRDAAFRVARRKPFRGGDMRDGQLSNVRMLLREQARQFAQAVFDPVDKAERLSLLATKGVAQTSEARCRSRPADLVLEPPRQGAKFGRGKPASRQRVLQRRQQWHRRKLALCHVEHQAQECPRWGQAQRQAGGIVDIDAPAPQFSGDAAGELAVGGDERCGRAWGFELAAQQKSNR
jgi:hypothetical protein